MFMGSGSMAIITWKDEQALKTSSSTSLTEMEYHRNISSAMAMGAMCIIIGLIYLIDLGVSWYNRGKITQDDGP
jgi:hypothetical protein